MKLVTLWVLSTFDVVWPIEIRRQAKTFRGVPPPIVSQYTRGSSASPMLKFTSISEDTVTSLAVVTSEFLLDYYGYTLGPSNLD